MALKPGDLAPDFTLMTHERKPQSLAELRGHKVLIWFYPAADTPG
jgi:peroxiredoxin Q/BCP